MKKALFVIVLLVAVLAVNAQTVPAKSTMKKSDMNMNMASTQEAVRVDVKVADLLKAITDNVTKDFAGYTIEEATSVTQNNVVTYEVVVVNGTETESLLYDKDGLFVKKMEKVV